MDLKKQNNFFMPLTELSLCSFNIIEIEVGELYNIYLIYKYSQKRKAHSLLNAFSKNEEYVLKSSSYDKAGKNSFSFRFNFIFSHQESRTVLERKIFIVIGI